MKKEIEIEKLWQDIDVKECDNVLRYDDLCSNVNYLKMYGRPNYEQNCETFKMLRKIMGEEKPAIFSFGCGVGLDYLGAVEVFGEKVVYYPIDECKWAITETKNYKSFEPKLPKRFMKFDESMFMLSITQRNPVLCFFHSLYSIKKDRDLKKELVKILQLKSNFYFVCNFTINNHFGPMLNERDFIADLMQDLSKTFALKKLDILNERGILISAERKN